MPPEFPDQGEAVRFGVVLNRFRKIRKVILWNHLLYPAVKAFFRDPQERFDMFKAKFMKALEKAGLKKIDETIEKIRSIGASEIYHP